MSDPGLGNLLDKTQTHHRDAIHVPIEPATAGEDLGVAAKIRRHTDGKWYRAMYLPPHAVVDPLLGNPVEEGDQFWAWIIPGSIKSLRHAWEHPELPPLVAASTEPAGPGPTHQWRESYEWMAKTATDALLSYDELMDAAKSWLVDGEELGVPMNYDIFPDGFWQHYQIITGVVVPESKQSDFFRCAC